MLGEFATVKPLREVWSDDRYSSTCSPQITAIIDDLSRKAGLNP
jgi:hypothetical protein